MNQSVPILIGGSSLAGMACAIRLHDLGHSVCVLEKSHFPRPKLCGEFLGPDALAALDRLRLLEVVRNQAFGPVGHTWFFDRAGRSFKINHRWMSRKYPYGLAISRHTLDHILVAHARNLGILIMEGRRIHSAIRFERDEFHLSVTAQSHNREQQTEDWHTPCLIDATGRSGKLTAPMHLRLAAQTLPPQTRIGVQCHVELPELPMGSALCMFLFAGGYGGIQPISATTANLCMMIDASLGKRLHADFPDFIAATIGQNPAAREMLQGAQRDGAFNTTADINLATRGGSRQAAAEPFKLIRIGDAGVTVDPFTGSGMAHALETGWLAADTVHAASGRKLDYSAIYQAYRQCYRRRFQARLTLMQWFRPLLECERAQQLAWPILPPFLPGLAFTLR